MDVIGLTGKRMGSEPAGVHGHRNERLPADQRDHPGGGDNPDVAHGDFFVLLLGSGGQDLPEAFDFDPVGQLHHHGPAVVMFPGPGLPGVLRTDPDITAGFFQGLQGARAHLLEKGPRRRP